MLISFVQNITLLISLSALYMQLIRFWEKETFAYYLLSGILFGTVGILGMLTPVALAPGIIFDGRSIILSLAGLFGGPFTAGIAAAISTTYRLWLGGPGTWVGVGVIMQSSLFGVIFYYLRRRYAQVTSPLSLLVFGFLVNLATLVLFLGIPGLTLRTIISQLAGPILLFYPLTTLLIGLFLADQENRLTAEETLRKTEKKLRESEERFRLLADNSQDLIYRIRLVPERCFEYVSPSATAILGYTPEDHYADPDLGFKIVHPDDKHLLELLAKGELSVEQPLVMRWLRRDGTVIWVEQSNTAVFDAAGKLVAIEGRARNVTAQKEAEDELKNNEKRLQALLYIYQHRFDTVQELLACSLDKALELTSSKVGYIYHYDEKEEEFILNSWSKGAMEECSIRDRQFRYKLSNTGMWGEAVRQKKPIIINDFQAPHPLKKGYPQGHVELSNYLTFPVFSNDQIVAVVGVGNKDSDYTNNDLLKLTLLMDSVWNIVERKQAEQELADRAQEMAQLYRQLDEEVDKALQIHYRTLPARVPEIEGLALSAYYQPAQRLGGDFYDAIKVGDKLILYLSDVTGHSLDGTMLSFFVKEAIDSYISLKPGEIHPENILNHLDRQFCREKYPDDYFICIFLAVLDLNTYQLKYTAAGFQTPPLVDSAAAKTKLISEGLPISPVIAKELKDFQEKTMTLTAGTTILFYTDGLTEQICKQSGKPYADRLAKVFYENSCLPPEIITAAINEDFREFNNGSLQGEDDITFMVVKIDPDLKETYQLQLSSSLDELPVLSKNISAKIRDFPEKEKFIASLHELVANAIEHGNKLTREKKVSVEIKVADNYISASVEDEGEGFNWREFMDDPLELEGKQDRGRGIIMARILSQNLYYSEKGTRATLVVKTSP